MFLKLFLWKDGKPFLDLDKVKINLVDKETGEFSLTGCDIGIFCEAKVKGQDAGLSTQLMGAISEIKEVETKVEVPPVVVDEQAVKDAAVGNTKTAGNVKSNFKVIDTKKGKDGDNVRFRKAY